MVREDSPGMNIPRGGRRGRLASGGGPAVGRQRTVDIDENGVYYSLSVKISERLHRRLGMACAAAGTTKVNLIVEAIEPVIDEILKEHGIRLD